MELVDCVEVIAVLQANYPHANFTPQSPAGWHATLHDYSREEVLAVLPSVMKNFPDYCPSAPRVAKAIDDTRTPPLNAQEAWDQVHAAIRACGHTKISCLRLHTTDDRIWKAAETIGWQRLGLTPFEQHGTLFAQFKGVLNDTIATFENSERRVMIEDRQAVGLGSGDE